MLDAEAGEGFYFMLPYKRSQRVKDLLKEEIAEIIQRRLKDPRVGFLTVTRVEVTEDLKLARVYVSVLKAEEREATMEILNAASSFVRSELGSRLKMRSVPAIEFRLDTSLDYAFKIDGILRELKKEEGGD